MVYLRTNRELYVCAQVVTAWELALMLRVLYGLVYTKYAYVSYPISFLQNSNPIYTFTHMHWSRGGAAHRSCRAS